MLRIFTIIFAVCAFTSTSAENRRSSNVDSNGQHPKIKLSRLISGHLSELNGKYQLRVTEVTYDPGGYIGVHHHTGPGIRCVTQGELTYVVLNNPVLYRSGDCFFESGDVAHTARNATDKPVILLNFEILPAMQSGGSAIPVP